MQNYKTQVVNLGDVYQATVESKEPSRNWLWKAVGAVFLIALCGAASFWLALTFLTHTEREHTTSLHSNPTTAHHQHMLTQIGRNRKAAIHLSFSGQSDKSRRLQWEHGVDQAFSTGGLKLENNEVLIPSNGLYFVYSQASFSTPCNSDGSDVPLSYSIQWSSPAAPSKDAKYLLNGVKTICQPGSKEEQDVYDVIYLGAVFQLYEGDRLSTEANHLEHIEGHSSKTFFGVFEL